MEERLSWFTAADTGRIWLRQIALLIHGVLFIKWRQMKVFKCLSLNLFFFSLSGVLCLSFLQPNLPVFTLKSYFCKMVILLFKPCLYESLSQRQRKECVLLTMTKLVNKYEVKVCFVLLRGGLTNTVKNSFWDLAATKFRWSH